MLGQLGPAMIIWTPLGIVLYIHYFFEKDKEMCTPKLEAYKPYQTANLVRGRWKANPYKFWTAFLNCTQIL